MYDVTKVLGVNKKLAENYIIDSDNLIGKKRKKSSIMHEFHDFMFIEMCEHNRAMAEKYGNSDAVQCWKLASLIATSSGASTDSLDDEIFSQQIPFPKILLESL